jgi:hypothetical protein
MLRDEAVVAHFKVLLQCSEDKEGSHERPLTQKRVYGLRFESRAS